MDEKIFKWKKNPRNFLKHNMYHTCDTYYRWKTWKFLFKNRKKKKIGLYSPFPKLTGQAYF